MFGSFQATDTSSENTTEVAKSHRPSVTRRITTSNACGMIGPLVDLDHQTLTELQDPADGEKYAAMAQPLVASVSAEHMMQWIENSF
jgi:hypothetical protein